MTGEISVTWSAILTQPDFTGSATYIEAVADNRGVHVVWATGSPFFFPETYYSLYSFSSNEWPEYKNVTDEQTPPLEGAYGSLPVVVATEGKAHVVYSHFDHEATLNDPMDAVLRVRELDFSTGQWQSSQQIVLRQSIHSNVLYPPRFLSISIAATTSDLHVVSNYLVGEDPIPRFNEWEHYSREIGNPSANWQLEDLVVTDADYGGNEEDADLISEGNDLHFIKYDRQYEFANSASYFPFSSGNWGNPFRLTPDDIYWEFKLAAGSANIGLSQNGLHCLWAQDNLSSVRKVFYRRQIRAIFDDIAENSFWTGDVWIGDTQPPREIINIPAGVTVTLDDDATLYLQGNWINVYGTFYFDPANVIFDGGEIFIHNDGVAYNTGTGSGTIYGEGSCINVKPGGKYITSNSGHQLSFTDGALFLNSGGIVELSDDSRMIFAQTSQKLWVLPGSEFYLGDNAYIEVNSQLDAQGTSEEPILFTSLYQNPTSQQYWKWIRLIGPGAGEPPPSLVQHAIFEYGDYGLFAYDCHPSIESSTFQNHKYYNLYLQNSNASLSGNSLQYAGSFAIFMNNSSPELFSNLISHSSKVGVYCYNYSAPKFGLYTPYDPGRNVIRDNTIGGIHANYYAAPFLGDWDEEQGIGGYNSIYGSEEYAVKAEGNTTVTAQFNWWGIYPVPSGIFQIDEGSIIDYSNALDYDPNEEMMAGLLSGGVSKLSSHGITNGIRGGDPDSLLRLARKYRYQKRPQSAVGIYKQLITNYPNNIAARWGLIEILSAFDEARLDSSTAFLTRLKGIHPNANMRRIAYDLLTGVLLGKGNIDAAITNGEEILALYPDTESEKTALFDLFNIFLNLQKDSLAAQNMLALLEQRYPEDELTMIAHHQMDAPTSKASGYMAGGLWKTSSGGTETTLETTISDQIPKQFQLHQNYPNPFNPTTTIRFGIPENQHVSLKIYAITGEEVATLIDGYRQKGYHELQWDGRNSGGREVASGMYIYLLRAGDERLVGKMLLVR